MQEDTPPTITSDPIEIDPKVLEEIEADAPDGFRENLDKWQSGEIHSEMWSFDWSVGP